MKQNYEHHIVITTKYHGPTNSNGSRITASYDGRRVTKSYDHALNSTGNHEAAALAFIAKHFPEYSIRAYGAIDTGYVFLVR